MCVCVRRKPCRVKTWTFVLQNDNSFDVIGSDRDRLHSRVFSRVQMIRFDSREDWLYAEIV